MKSKLLFPFILLLSISYGQIGIGTTAPNAQLDIRSSNQAAPANNDGILIPKIDVFPATNPTAAQQGMLVYLTTATTFGGNPKPIGFYYWNNSPADWIGISSATNGDHDWYEEGTTNPPNAITDDMFHTGNVAIGKNTADYPLEVVGTNLNAAINVSTTNNINESFNPNFGIKNSYTGTSTDDVNLMYNFYNGTSTGIVNGTSNNIFSSNTTSYSGTYNYIYGNQGIHLGVFNNIGDSGSLNTGVRNYMYNRTSNSIKEGISNEIYNNTGTGFTYGVHNTLGNDNSGTASHVFGLNNSIIGTGNSPQYGVASYISNSGNGDHYGAFNQLSGSGSGVRYGTYNQIDAGTNTKYGVYNNISSNSLGNIFGVNNILNNNQDINIFGTNNELSSNGNYLQNGTQNILSGSNSSGPRLGTSNYISTTGSGTHYGVYNQLNGGGTGFRYGTFNLLNTNTSGDVTGTYNNISSTNATNSYGMNNIFSSFSVNPKYGTYNSFTATANGLKYGLFNSFLNSNNSFNHGMYNYFNSTSNFTQYGVYNNFVSGSGDLYGDYNYFYLSGNGDRYANSATFLGSGTGDWFGYDVSFDYAVSTGTGNKYGLHVNIPPSTTGSAHYGVYSYAGNLTSGYSAYLSGRVSIGSDTTTATHYIMPLSRGTNGQIMQTDGIGNVTWQNPNTALNSYAWTTTGNSGTNGGNTTTAGTNFIGTTDNQNLDIRTNNIFRARFSNLGEFFVGALNTTTTGDLMNGVSNATFPWAVNGYSNQNGAGVYGQITSGATYFAGVQGEYNGTHVQGTGVRGIALTTTAGTSFGATHTGVNGIATTAGTYKFGVYGSGGTTTRSGGVMGYDYGLAIGGLGYYSSASTDYSVYGFGLAYQTGVAAGRFSSANYNDFSQKNTNIGLGIYGGVMGGWVRGMKYGFHTKGDTYSLYVDGNGYTNKPLTYLIKGKNQQKIPSYMTSSMNPEVSINGKTNLENGKVFVSFDKNFSQIISNIDDIIITATPQGKSNGVYINQITKNGFWIIENNDGASNVKISWIAITKIIGEENPNIPDDLLSNDFDKKMDKVMFNENNTREEAQSLWWDGTKIRWDKPENNKVDTETEKYARPIKKR